MMRAVSDPRRIYSRNGVTHVCWRGTYFAPGKTTEVDIDKEVTIEEAPTTKGRLRVTVTQRRGKKPALTETWSQVQVPVEHRRKAS